MMNRFSPWLLVVRLRAVVLVLAGLVAASLPGVRAAGPVHAVLHEWELGPLAEGSPTEFLELAGGDFIAAGPGGAHGLGCVFRLSPTGAITVLAHFSGPSGKNRGAHPRGRLVAGADGHFYGTTQLGGAHDLGTIYKVTLAGELTTLVDFAGTSGPAKGARPLAGLVIGPDGNFFGTTSEGGSGTFGTVFRLTPAGGFTTLVEFTSYTGQDFKGAFPSAALISGSDGNLYGSTYTGGAGGQGTIFRLSPAGDFTTLVDFTGNGAANRGAYPEGALIESGGAFYGVTHYGGTDGLGTVFRMSTAGLVTTLVEFSGNLGVNKGAEPVAALVVGLDGNFYGTTSRGAANDFGTIFKMTAAGELTTLIEFGGGGPPDYGAYPSAGLTPASDGTFYGTTGSGGAGGQGTFFRMTAGGALATLVDFTVGGAEGFGGDPRGALALGTDQALYGTTRVGGAHGFGSVFKITARQLTTLVSFTGSSGDARGAYPLAGLVRGPDGAFYGTTSLRGAEGHGTIFRMTLGGEVTTLVDFTGTTGGARGAGAQARLTLGDDGLLYGTTSAGGATGRGTVFKVTPAGMFTTLVDFTGNGATNAGAYPAAELVKGAGALYGTTTGGGADGAGTVFKLGTDGVLATVISFDAFEGYPAAGLALGPDGNLYGSTTTGGNSSGGGDDGPGTIFRLTPAGVKTTLVALSSTLPPNKGREISGTLALGADGNFYGTSRSGGDENFHGTLFKMTPAGVFTTVLEFSFDGFTAQGAHPAAGLTLGADGLFYGTTADGGRGGGGTVFRAGVAEPRLPVLAATGAPVVGEPAGTTYTAIGMPAFDPGNGAAFLATVRGSAGSVRAICVGNPPRVLARAGGAAPETNGAEFASFDPPLISEAGVAFAARLVRKNGVTASNDAGVWTTAWGGGLRLVARTGTAAPGVPAALLKSLPTYSLRGAELALWLRLASGPGVVAGPQDDVLAMADANGATRLLGEGDLLDLGEGDIRVNKITAFTPSLDAPGQDRWHAPGVLAAVATMANGQIAVVRLLPGAPLEVQALNRDPSQPDLLRSFGLPAVGAPDTFALRSVDREFGGRGIVSAVISVPPFQGFTIREGDATNFLDGLNFAVPREPVINDQGHYALLATLQGTGVTSANALGLWAGSARGGYVGLVARTGFPAPDFHGAPIGGVNYARFRSFGLPDGERAGALFIAALVGQGIHPQNNVALFAVNFRGVVRQLLRHGDPLIVGGRTRRVSSFRALNAGAPPLGTRRAFTTAGSFAALVTFTDRTQAIVQLDVR